MFYTEVYVNRIPAGLYAYEYSLGFIRSIVVLWLSKQQTNEDPRCEYIVFSLCRKAKREKTVSRWQIGELILLLSSYKNRFCVFFLSLPLQPLRRPLTPSYRRNFACKSGICWKKSRIENIILVTRTAIKKSELIRLEKPVEYWLRANIVRS